MARVSGGTALFQPHTQKARCSTHQQLLSSFLPRSLQLPCSSRPCPSLCSSTRPCRYCCRRLSGSLCHRSPRSCKAPSSSRPHRMLLPRCGPPRQVLRSCLGSGLYALRAQPPLRLPSRPQSSAISVANCMWLSQGLKPQYKPSTCFTTRALRLSSSPLPTNPLT